MLANQTPSLPASPARSGRYQFRYWHIDAQGSRAAFAHPPKAREGVPPDLINTAYRNANGVPTVFGLAFDLDAHRADPRWLDAQGRLDWPRINAHLAEAHPPIFHEIAHVVRSTGGKGLGVVVAINPLPIQESTEKNQRVLLNLQSRLIVLFDALGFGADPGARGLQRDLPNFQDPSRSLYDNRLALRRAELSDEGVATRLHAYLNVLASAEQREKRIYNDARAETGLARLVAWLLGAYDPQCGVWVPSFLTGETVYASTKELVAVTGLCSRFLRGYLKHPPAWLEATYLGKGEGWCLRVPLGRAVQRLLPRAEMLLATTDKATSPHTRKFLFSVAATSEPQFVSHGEHNAWVTALSLAYKWHGYSREEALAKILLRSAALPDGATSSTCREIPSIVRTLFKNVPQTLGRFAGRDLPEWMTNDNLFGFGKKLSPRGGVAPGLFVLSGGVESLSAATPPKLAPTVTPTVLAQFLAGGATNAPLAASLVATSSSHSLDSRPDAQTTSRPEAKRPAMALAAIRWRQRVGIFDGDRLVACFTKRHYRAHNAVDFLTRRSEYAGIDLRLYTPHLAAQTRYREAIETATNVLVSSAALGAKSTHAEKLAAWEAKRGIQRGAFGDLPSNVPF